jgi:TonB family protein
MRVRWRGESGAIRSSLSFSVSGLIHATLLGLVVFGNAARDLEKPKSMYDEAIKPQEKKVVWYHLQDRLPDVAPATPARAVAKPLRATRKFEQRIVAGARDDGRPPQLVWSPAPEVAAPKPMPLPNVLAVEVKRPSRPFTAPASAPVAATAKLPDAAPAVGALPVAPAGPNLATLKKTFTPPPSSVTATAKLPDAAPALGALPAAPAGPNLAAPRKAFTVPSTARPAAAPSNEPEPPAIHGAPAADTTRLAIIGLNPAKAPDLPVTPESRSAGFSAGPVPHPDGAETDGHAAGVAVPGVTVRDGIGRQQLLAAIRPMSHVIPTGPPPAPPPTRVSAAPDPALEGRVVYTMAIQMPNITSYSGSWMVWYAAREQASGAMRAPSPLRKVDPKYIASAVADGVEGVVRLGATIRRDGHVDMVKLLRHLDDRLDRSAMESLAKWEFEPARRDGAPVDVDAVFEIPFRLAPKLSK